MYNQKDTLKKVFASHSEIGSHTYSHINMKRSKPDKIKDEIDKTSRIFKDITGFDIKLIRPPYGAYTNDIIKDYNYSFILWNADTDDWKNKDVERIVNYILNNAQDGNIILMHDSYATSVEAVKIALPQLYARGVQVVSVSKLAELKGKTLEVGKAYRSMK
jgi:peptidoglycan/xylan/chitin deacetylase (PgdA/CDA1 family)